MPAEHSAGAILYRVESRKRLYLILHYEEGHWGYPKGHIEKGETLESIAATCGTTVAAIKAANPGISGSLAVGQVITVPGSNYTPPSTPIPTTPVPTTNPTSTASNGAYTVKPGDTFSAIAKQFGVSVSALWAANPSIQNINLLYIGQVLSIPGSSGIVIQPAPTEELIARSWGTVPRGTAYADVKLSNRSQSQVYVSLQGTTKDGIDVIREYPVEGTFDVSVPAGWYVYVAWVGGQKMEGQFNLRANANLTMKIYKDKILVE